MENIALFLLDIVQNSIEAQASSISIDIEKVEVNQQLRITIADNGQGISNKNIDKILNPFYTSRTTRKVGMGLPLLKQHVEQTGGYLHIISEVGRGTTVTFAFNLWHIDCPPPGNFADVLSTLIAANPQINFYACIRSEPRTFSFESKRFFEIFDGIPISQGELRQYLLSFLSENMEWLFLSNCTT